MVKHLHNYNIWDITCVKLCITALLSGKEGYMDRPSRYDHEGVAIGVKPQTPKIYKLIFKLLTTHLTI